MGRYTATVPPANRHRAHHEPAAGEAMLSERLARDRMQQGHIPSPWRCVAGHVDVSAEAGVHATGAGADQLGSDHVGAEPLADAPEVDRHTLGKPYPAPVVIELESSLVLTPRCDRWLPLGAIDLSEG
ncbi:MAG: hypothetical protein FD127_1268, partial [Acidimicrobiaceae bacterium]